MISATHRFETLNPPASPAPGSTSPAASMSSFAKELATVVGGSVNQSKNGSGASQFLVTAALESHNAVTPISSGPNAGTTTTPSTTTAPPSDIPTMLGMGPVAGTAPVQQSTSATPTAAAAPISEADAYWDAQPTAVQVLRNMPDGEAKNQLALNLANQGYSIDTQIMVWGWDPQMTMTVRENQGYSWVPSYGQANIPVGPGLSMPEDPTTYNPGNAPAGAIIVSTAFDKGTILNPLVQTNSSST